jgi:hypothetical protein
VPCPKKVTNLKVAMMLLNSLRTYQCFHVSQFFILTRCIKTSSLFYRLIFQGLQWPWVFVLRFFGRIKTL